MSKNKIYHKAKAKQVYMTQSQVTRALIQKEITEKSMIMLLGIPLIVLRDKYSFGKKRLELFTEEVLKQVKCVENNVVTLEELHEVIKKETGMEIKI